MLYYKITVQLNTDPDTEKENPKNSGHEYSARLAEKIFLAAADKNTDSSEHYLFMAALSGNEILFGLITHTSIPLPCFLEACRIGVTFWGFAFAGVSSS